uniref:Uncharacterized protein n=1 Tax=Branchiostoma floridae TaxID=7739 RepID=C3ZMP6_BRAFL|eukprot:XP_002590142.1 hypothetical protein BRAFLDRAFT_126052 [Branchiostoma floridae]
MRRAEDQIIAYTWRHFLDNPDQPDWLLRNPMTKVTNIFVLLCQRGWTTWTTAAVDKRVFAIAPMVMDLLNLQKNDSLQKSRSEDAIIAYTWKHFLDNPDQPDWLLRNPMTKAAVRAMDTVQDFVKKMTGNQPEKFLVAGASKRGWTTWTTAAVDKRVFAIVPIVMDLLNMQKGTTSGMITLHTNIKPMNIQSFHARTLDGKRRDFRLVNQPPGETKPQPHPVIWLPQDVQDMGNGTYVAEFDIPAVGWLAFFIQATFPAPHGTALEFTTEVHIIPETFPFPECHGTDCRGTLL